VVHHLNTNFNRRSFDHRRSREQILIMHLELNPVPIAMVPIPFMDAQNTIKCGRVIRRISFASFVYATTACHQDIQLLSAHRQPLARSAITITTHPSMSIGQDQRRLLLSQQQQSQLILELEQYGPYCQQQS
jgi:hypothetical protein